MNITSNLLTVTLAAGMFTSLALAQNSAPEIKFDSVSDARRSLPRLSHRRRHQLQGQHFRLHTHWASYGHSRHHATLRARIYGRSPSARRPG